MVAAFSAASTAAADVRATQQQLAHILDRLEAAAGDALRLGNASAQAIAALEAAVSQLRQSRLLSRMGALASSGGSEAAASALQKLVVRTHSLIGTNLARQDGPASQLRGYLLAYELAEQTDFDVWAANAATWAQSSVSLLANSGLQSSSLLLRAAMQLADAHLLGGVAGLRLDYNRQVVLPNVPKFGAGLVRIVEMHISEDAGHSDEPFLVDVLQCLTSQLHQFSSIYRPLTARIHEVTIKLILKDVTAPVPTFDAVHAAATRLLSALHLTGASNAAAARRSGSANAPKSTQAQLWHTTVTTVLRTMNDVASACTSTLLKASNAAAPQSGDRLPLEIAPEDDHSLHAGLISAFLRLNGAVHVLLSCPTSSAVPIPIAAILTSGLDLLSYGPQSRMKPGSDGSLHMLQLADLGILQMATMSLIAVTATACQEAFQSHAAQVLATFTIYLQRNASNDTLRNAAFKTLAILLDAGGYLDIESEVVPSARLAIDPASRTLPRLAQACLAEVSRLFISGLSSSAGSTQQQSGDPNGVSRKAKRQRVFESSSLLGTALDGPFAGKTAADMETVTAAVSIFKSVFPHLITNMRPVHADLSQTGVQLMIALAELLMHSSAVGSPAIAAESITEHARVALTATTLAVLAQILTAASGRLLSLASGRAWTVFELGRRSASPQVRAAADRGRIALDQILHPRIPALLPLRLATEADIGHEAAQWADEERKLGELEADSVRGVSEREALVKVLDAIPSAVPSTESSMTVVASSDSGLSTSGLKRSASAMSQTTASADSTQHVLQHHQHPLAHSHSVQLGNSGRASPDPVKPLHRPSTPRIGSPSPSRKVFSERTEEARMPETPSKRVNEVVMADEVLLGNGVDDEDEDDEEMGKAAPTVPTSSALKQPAGQDPTFARSTAADDSEDEEMPQIDLGSDEEEDADD
ncbi:hypothetical protein OC844_002984 [Tilletia horrida]|nr:hypothetical protein OC844_002984 [Tilletia horrida]